MNIKVLAKKPSGNYSEAIIIPFYEGIKADEINFPVKEVEQAIRYFVEENEFSGKFKEVQAVKLPRTESPKKVVLVGLGKEEDSDLEKLRRVFSKAVKETAAMKPLAVDVILPTSLVEVADAVRAITEGLLLGSYKFHKYIKDKKVNTIEVIHFITENVELVESAMEEGEILAQSTILARDLVNEPANVLTPHKMAEIAAKTGRDNGFEVEVFEENKIEELGMVAFLTVGRASENRPRLIVMRYKGDTENPNEIIGLVGKGLTYDSGGLSIKPKEGMLNMKCDMGGAASVIGAMKAIALLKPRLNVTAIVAACENAIDATAYRGGDIINTMAGKTVFIGSTDAEGRLTLADAIHFAIMNEKVTRVVDVATLTGGAVVALGAHATLVVSNDDEFYSKLEASTIISGEKIWRMPTFDDYREQLKSKVADLTNSAGNPQAITAAMFVEEFVQKKPWIHMDIAGTAFTGSDRDYIATGGTGVGVRTLYQLVKNLSE
ncbi:leucyl aminopeptidase [Alkalicella caledoniensis]|uniref:Probable cytosol aminopeptidase n=1 Tax=Alkalicella caledoniensis TaxID=2731377 RepID=A0A7G9W9V4_ALKCA|nr:leucyl aminopeptidase [Alkalicella caledoniensis]QNO15466.1 leucyl aminopeptidase [Alkalicella caledoniensis]